jgi:hypothetical protein
MARAWFARALVVSILLEASGCLMGVAGAAGGAGLGYVVADDNKALGTSAGAAAGFAVGSVVWLLSCVDNPLGAYTASRSAAAISKPWYCAGP